VFVWTAFKLAFFYAGAAMKLQVGYAQNVFNWARAKYLMGIGPSPGNNVVEFAKQHGLEMWKN
jgi:hypothetical protein